MARLDRIAMIPSDFTTSTSRPVPPLRAEVDAEQAYLLVEFETAWRHLGGLEAKRLHLFLGYCLVSSLLVAGWSWGGSLSGWAPRAIAGSWLVLLSLACRYIAISERQATERYRNKINLLRRTLLEGLASPRLQAMQQAGNDWALQVNAAPAKALRAQDMFVPARWTTALFMKLTYDLGAWLGLLLLLLALQR